MCVEGVGRDIPSRIQRLHQELCLRVTFDNAQGPYMVPDIEPGLTTSSVLSDSLALELAL